MCVFKFILFPFAAIYWIVTYVRNKFFDLGIYKQHEFSTPIISVGNITVGGTGKTPHTQYILNLLKDKSVATLSRGYKRKTTGYFEASEDSTPSALGDEPYQMHKRFPKAKVTVCEDRVLGVQKIIEKHNPDVILLDDAYQHRHVKPSFQIVLVDYNRPIWKDFVFPVGFLREGKYALKRADVIVVSKCPILNKNEMAKIRARFSFSQNQKIFFSRMQYGDLRRLDSEETISCGKLLGENQVLLVTGIAQADGVRNYLQGFTPFVTHLDYADHYAYEKTDILHIQELHQNLNSEKPTVIITTEKDVYKLQEKGLLESNSAVYVLPIEPVFDLNENDINKEILDFIEKQK